jgi:hypothetical protein
MVNIEKWNYSKTWYHGSPFKLTVLREGSTITQDKDLARVFSHKPTIVCRNENGSIRHNGENPGFLYCITEALSPDDVYPHPNSSMKEGKEWLTKRELRLSLICRTNTLEGEKLTQDQVVELRKQMAQLKDKSIQKDTGCNRKDTGCNR